jgi:hypothetical protein
MPASPDDDASVCLLPYWLLPQDLPRTFPRHPWLAQPEGQAALRQVLTAYAGHDHSVGYCQVRSGLVDACHQACTCIASCAMWCGSLRKVIGACIVESTAALAVL